MGISGFLQKGDASDGGVDIFTLRLVCRNLLDVGQYALYLANYLTGDMNAGSSLTWLMHAIRVWNVYNINIYIYL